MKLQDILDFHEKMKGFDFENFSEAMESLEVDDYLEQAGEYVSRKSEEGKKVILQRMSEKDYVVLVREVENLITSSMQSEGMGMFFTFVKAEGTLEAYNHTLILSIIAILIEAEVL